MLELFVEAEPAGGNRRERDLRMAAETSHTCHLQAGSPGRLVEQPESLRAGAVDSSLCPAKQSAERE